MNRKSRNRIILWFPVIRFYSCCTNEPSEWLRGCCVVNFIFFSNVF